MRCKTYHVVNLSSEKVLTIKAKTAGKALAVLADRFRSGKFQEYQFSLMNSKMELIIQVLNIREF